MPTGLESVWPVQRVEAPRPKGDDWQLEPTTVEESMRHEKPEATQIQQVMRQVSAAKPSDSSVELILPRRQRPAVSPAPASAPTIIRPIQTQPEADVGKKETATPPQAFVQTGIGPLPTDLWDILGTPLPGQTETSGLKPQPAQPTNPAVQRAIAAAERPAPTSSAVPARTSARSTNGHTPTVQREATNPAQSTGQARPTSVATVGSGLPVQTAQTQGAEGGGAAGQGEQGEKEQANIDELARQVYSEVRRRLAIEWERGRGQF